jgi:hypothetical protein
VTSQNRMNAGAEYVLYRVWATLQDSRGIHAESLFTCLGALSGFACQTYARHAGARGGADAGRYALTSIAASDGLVYLHGDSLNSLLTESPLSPWALVSRAVQKVGRPLPDIGAILTHVTRTLGTSAFALSRVADRHRPRHSAMFYLQQLWPQILPIAQRFCRRPAQLPVLFGIALQRAIEHTTELLDPTVSATIAMECAVAMSRIALPGAPVELIESPGSRMVPPGTRSMKKARTGRMHANAARALAATSFSSRIPATKVFATIASVAIIAIGSAVWRAEQRGAGPVSPRMERRLRVSASQTVSTLQRVSTLQPGRVLEPGKARSAQEALEETPPPPSEEAPLQNPQTPASAGAAAGDADSDIPATPPEQPTNEGIITEAS